jgi:O-antigen/teichoic acid export membrane protein
VALLAAAKVFGAASGFVTGPLLAQALGASGRGDLAAVLVPFSLVQGLLAFGIPAYAYRALPRGRAPAEVIGSLAAPLLLVGVAAMIVAVPVADALAGGRSTVRTWLIVGFMATPLVLVQSLLTSSLAALERWRAVAISTMIPFAVALTGIVILFVTDTLTVGSAAAVTIGGALLSVVPAVPMLTTIGRPRFQRPLARRGISFGIKAWAGGLAQMANLRLDQVLMITAVPPRTLGLYAVATTLASAPTFATGALAQPLMPRIAGGEIGLMPRGVRMALAMSAGVDLALALIAPTLLAVLFGPEFRDAVPMALVLLVASVPFCGAMVLSSALQADGAPVIPTAGEAIALVVTVVGLLALLRPLGGMGAAIVSVAAYSATFLFQLVMASRRIGVPIRTFVVPDRGDVRWARRQLRAMTVRLKQVAA